MIPILVAPGEPPIVAALDVSFAVDESFVALDITLWSLGDSAADEEAPRLDPKTVFVDDVTCEAGTTLSGKLRVEH